MDWRSTLTDIFGGYIAQDTLEEGVSGLLFVSEDDGAFHQNVVQAIETALQAALLGDPSVLEIINRSGYRVATPQQAHAILLDLQQLYLDEYNQRSKGKLSNSEE